MKQFVSYILLAPFLFNIVGYFAVYEVLEYLAEEDMERRKEAGFSPEDVVMFVFMPEECHFIDWDEKEFIYKHQLYDMVRKEVQPDGRIFVFAVHDQKEQDVLSKMENQSAGNYPHSPISHPSRRQNDRHLAKVQPGKYLAQNFNGFTVDHFTNISYRPYFFRVKEYLPELTTPPPKA